MNFKILGAILRKDVQSLLPLVLLTTLLFAGDVLITRLELLPLWTSFRMPVLLLVSAVLILSVFQLDAPVSMVDDWLCRPVPRKELLTAKLMLLFSAIYLSRAITMFFSDLALGFSLMESLQEAVLLQDRLFQLVLPIVLLTAVITQSLVQGIAVLIALFVCVFMIPTPLVQAPGPLRPGIGDALMTSAGLAWLALFPAKAVSVLLVAFGFWLVYWRRSILKARIVLVLTSCVIPFFVVLPMWLLPWNSVSGLQTTLARADSASQETTKRIELRSPRACFPATRIGNLASDAAFNAARQYSGLALWTNEDLRDSGPDSVTFLTGIEAGALPPDWRAKLNYVQADYYTSGTGPAYSLRPARYITDNAGGSSLSHAWVLPGSAVQDLAARDASLELSYSLALLEPRQFSVPADGKRHELPGLGYCSAAMNAPANSIDVDCFIAFRQPAQISAELNQIPASRVYAVADFAPAWLQWAHSERVRLSIGSPRLAAHDTITVTAWETAAYLDKSLTLPGILGADTTTCPLPTADGNGFQKARWGDSAPHEISSISVDAGVQLEVLDFGGAGSPILLLPGLGATGHSYDDLAPQLARNHRVVAVTRRGTGGSSKPDFGFDTPRLAQDVLQVMDAMGFDKVLLVGSSIAGEELTWLGGHHPERFNGLVYLDAAYDRSGDSARADRKRMRELGGLLPPEPPIPPAALVNYEAMTKFLAERGHEHYPEGELIALFRANSPFLAGTPSIDARTQQAITAAIQAPDYAAVKIPALAIYAFEDPNAPLPPWYDPNDKQLLANLAEHARIVDSVKRESIELFRRNVDKGQVMEMQDASHYLIQSNQREVLEAIERFVASSFR